MRPRLAISLLMALFVLTSCATYSQLMVGPDGSMQSVSTTGRGLIGMATASDATNTQVAKLRAAGFLEIERAGVIGVTLNDSTTILLVKPGSPADSAGIRAGDRIVSVAGQPVHLRRDAQILLFGVAGTPVTLAASRADSVTEYHLVRSSYVSVYGQPTK